MIWHVFSPWTLVFFTAPSCGVRHARVPYVLTGDFVHTQARELFKMANVGPVKTEASLNGQAV